MSGADRTEDEARRAAYSGCVARLRQEVDRVLVLLEEMPPAEALRGPPTDGDLGVLYAHEAAVNKLRVGLDQLAGGL